MLVGEEKMKNTPFIILFASFFLAGCSEPFSDYYHDMSGGIDSPIASRRVLPTDEPKLFRASNPESDGLGMLEAGYLPVGFSSFYASNVEFKGAIKQARKVQAEIVLVYCQHKDSISGMIPLTTPESQSSATRFNISGSNEGYSGYAKTVTYGSHTTYLPFNVDRYDYFATYWAKIKPPILGVWVNDLSPEMRSQIKGNKGVYVVAVIRNSPAFEDDILAADIIKRVGSHDLAGRDDFFKAVEHYAGEKTTVELVRDGQAIVKIIRFNRKN